MSLFNSVVGNVFEVESNLSGIMNRSVGGWWENEAPLNTNLCKSKIDVSKQISKIIRKNIVLNSTINTYAYQVQHNMIKFWQNTNTRQ